MTPAARIEAAIEVLGRIDAEVAPAERVMAQYLRARRYMGSKDRRAVGDLVYRVLRARARLDWWLERAGPGPGDGMTRPRRSVLAALVLIEGRAPEDLAALCDGGTYHPAPLDPDERALATALAARALGDPEQPPWVAAECPEWLWPEFEDAFGGRAAAELAALAGEAPLELRVNTLKGDRAAALTALAEEAVTAAPTPLSPLGLRVAGHPGLSAGPAYESGLVEVQDEGAQVVALVADARPGMAVVDFCAGAGGKTLALAAAMANKGRLFALDLDQRRLDRAAKRLKRAGVGIVTRRRLADDDWLARRAGAFDRVLVDAPCSGTGAWRRQPDARWRLTPEALDAYRATQARILAQAAPLVAGGGRLVYATCSLLPSENGRQVEAFLSARPDFTLLAMESLWAETIAVLGGDAAPAPPPFAGPYLLLTPARHGTDGFFAAALERRKRA
jgi:16S rRNA (cytosine967-C5)-methyltransferase